MYFLYFYGPPNSENRWYHSEDFTFGEEKFNPVGIYMFKVKNRNTVQGVKYVQTLEQGYKVSVLKNLHLTTLYDVYNQHTINILYFVKLNTKFTTEKLQQRARGPQKSELLYLK